MTHARNRSCNLWRPLDKHANMTAKAKGRSIATREECHTAAATGTYVIRDASLQRDIVGEDQLGCNFRQYK